jgi:predicted PurR-regulated permease PerM
MTDHARENRLMTYSVAIIAAVALFAALYLARTLFIPIALACILALVMAPIVRILTRIGLRRSLASGLVVTASGATVALVLAQLSTPAAQWFARLPDAIVRARLIFREAIGTLENVKEITENVSDLSDGDKLATVVVEGPNVAEVFLTSTGQALAMIGITIVLLFFLLTNGQLIFQKTIYLLPKWRDKKRLISIGRSLQGEVSKYLLTITLINAALGAATAILMMFFGIPDPILWGALAATLNFIPYVGAMLTAGAILLASIMAFSTPLGALLPPGAFLALSILEGQFLTPSLVGSRLTLNPVVVFVGLLFWGWLWGVAGLLIAVPLLVIAKIFCDRIEKFKVFGEYLSSEPPGLGEVPAAASGPQG